MRRFALQAVATLLALSLAAFFGFVGFMKATAPVAELAEHHAWTVAIPEPLGRLVGWSEIGCALGLLIARLWPGRIGLALPVAAVLVVNQFVAAAVHLSNGETDALPQNGILVTLLVLLAKAARRLARGRVI